MTETQKTSLYAVVAIVLGGLAWWATTPTVSRVSLFDDTGEPFYPELTDAGVPKALEVVEFDDRLHRAKPLRVELKENKWTIPSHHNYPADAEDRLAKTAGAIINLRKDSFITDNKDHHAELGVVDPFEESQPTGWGTRVKLFDEADNIVTDLIVGKDVANKDGFKYMRVPGKDRVYAVDAKDLDLSIKFTDWIDTDLLDISSFDIDEIVLKDYQIDAARGQIIPGSDTTLVKRDNQWQIAGLADKEETNEDKARDLATALADLKIVGVREKPPGLTPDLRAPGGEELYRSMIERGFYLKKDGEVVSDKGETIAETTDGLVYTLRFGGVILGTGDEITAGDAEEKAVDTKAAKSSDDDQPAENRFLLVSVAFDESKFPPIESAETGETETGKPEKEQDGAEPGAPPAEKVEKADPQEKKSEADAKPGDAPKEAEPKADDAEVKEKAEPGDAPKEAEPKADDAEAKEKAEAEKKKNQEELQAKQKEREQKIEEGKKKAQELSNRYAHWYYVISNESYQKIRLTRADLVKQPEPAKDDQDAKGSGADEPAKKSGTETPAPAKPEPEPAAPKPADEKGPADKPAADLPDKPAADKADTNSEAESPDPQKETSPGERKEE